MKLLRIPLLVVTLLTIAAAFGISMRQGTSVAPGNAAAVADAVHPITAAPPGSLSLITEPDDGMDAVLAAINGAQKSVDLVMYEFDDAEIENALITAESRGVAVRVLLNQGYYGKPDSQYGQTGAYNQGAYDLLKSKGVAVEWTPDYFALTHQKTLVVDGAQAIIMTFNLTPKYYSTSRDFGITDTDGADVAAIESAFQDDWKGGRGTAPTGDDLVWSPGSKAQLLSLIAGASSTLDVYNEEMDDPDIASALQDAALRGVAVRVDMTYDTQWKAAFNGLLQAGVVVRTYAGSSKVRYIHAKMILVDDATAFVGSENFSEGSLESNRELGIVVSDPGILTALSAVFDSDWSGARPYTAR